MHRLAVPSVGWIGQLLNITLYWTKDREQLDVGDDERDIQGRKLSFDLATGIVDLGHHLVSIARIHNGRVATKSAPIQQTIQLVEQLPVL